MQEWRNWLASLEIPTSAGMQQSLVDAISKVRWTLGDLNNHRAGSNPASCNIFKRKAKK